MVNIHISERSMFPGGSIKSALQLFYALKGKYNISIAVYENTDHIKYLTSNNVIPVIYPNRDFYKSGKFLPKFFKFLSIIHQTVMTTHIISRSDVDVIHANNGLPFNIPDILSGLILNKKVICHIRGIHKLNIIDQILSRKVEKFIAVSSAVKINYSKQGIDPNKITIINNSVFLPDDVTESIFLKDEEIIIGVFSRLVRWKGVHELILAFSNIVNSYSNVRLVIAGNGPEKENLELLSKNLSVNTKVTFVGHIDNVEDLMKKCYIIVEPSIKPEPFSRVIIEAMMLGIPIIGTNCGGNPESIIHTITGLLYEPNDIVGLENSLKYFLDNPGRRQLMALESRITARNKFSFDIIKNQILGFYAKIIQSF